MKEISMDSGKKKQKRGHFLQYGHTFYKEYYILIVENSVESVENRVETGWFSTFGRWKKWKVKEVQRFVDAHGKIWYNSLISFS